MSAEFFDVTNDVCRKADLATMNMVVPTAVIQSKKTFSDRKIDTRRCIYPHH